MPNFCYMESTSIMVGGEFSLTKCRLPNVDGCTNSRPSPDWIVAEFEDLASKSSPLSSTATKLNLYGICKSNFIRLVCMIPSCESNNRLRGYKNCTECNDLLNWYKSVKLYCFTIVLYDATLFQHQQRRRKRKLWKRSLV